MRKYLDIFRKCVLFDGIEEEHLLAMLSCLNGRVITADKDQYIFNEGDPAESVGLLLSGKAQIIKNDFFGNRTIVAAIEPAQLFGESFACADVEEIPVSVVASEKCEILLMDCRRIIATCNNVCQFHTRIIYNLLRIVANKNLMFNQKIEITSQRTTREKLMTYLLIQAKIQGKSSFTIPFDRQQLADYLEVERSAMSAELSRMQKDGLIEYKRSWFRLLEV